MKAGIDAVVDALNAAFKADPVAIQALLCQRIPCSQELADHTTVQVSEWPSAGHWALGTLGLLNGAIEPATGHRIASMWSEPGPDGKATMLGFCVYEEPLR